MASASAARVSPGRGVAQIGRKAFWPGWTPPPEMLLRRPDLPRHMDGGMENPLGARALYLFKGDKDSLFRIHGTNEPDTIGQAVSSGCIRMLIARRDRPLPARQQGRARGGEMKGAG